MFCVLLLKCTVGLVFIANGTEHYTRIRCMYVHVCSSATVLDWLIDWLSWWRLNQAVILPCRHDVFLVHRCTVYTCNYDWGMIGSVTKVTTNQRHRCSSFNDSRARINLHKIHSKRVVEKSVNARHFPYYFFLVWYAFLYAPSTNAFKNRLDKHWTDIWAHESFGWQSPSTACKYKHKYKKMSAWTLLLAGSYTAYRAFRVVAARLWNSLPSHVTAAPPLSLNLLLSS